MAAERIHRFYPGFLPERRSHSSAMDTMHRPCRLERVLHTLAAADVSEQELARNEYFIRAMPAFLFQSVS